MKQKNCLFEKGNDLFSVSIANVFPLHVFNQIPSAIYWGSYSHYLIVAVLISIIALLLSLVLSRFLIHSITKPLSKIINGIMSIGENNLDTRIRVLDGGEIGLLVQQFNTMLDRTQHLMDSIIETEQKKRESELALIQMKMTPHFFYNALESICGLIVTDDKAQAIQVINLLATFYRGILSQGMEIITIEQELSISDSYIRIMQICYPNKFDYRVTCALKYRAIKINKLTLQPILENAIHHGFSTISTGGIISVTVFENSNSIYIDVIDNGCGFSRTTETDLFTNQKQLHTESYGLKNTNERIQMYFGNEYGLSFIPVTEGVTVRIRLPIKI
ncbi:MAG: histidine kinase [Clostridia bacterium]